MKSVCSAMFGRCSGRVRDTFPESCLGRIPQPGFCSRQFSFLSQVCSAASFQPGVSAQLFWGASFCWSHLALTWMRSDIIACFSIYFVRYFHYVWQLCSGTMFEKHVRGFQEACSTGHDVRQDVRMFEIVCRLNVFVLNPMFECSLNICSDPILVVNVRKGTKIRTAR